MFFQICRSLLKFVKLVLSYKYTLKRQFYNLKNDKLVLWNILKYLIQTLHKYFIINICKSNLVSYKYDIEKIFLAKYFNKIY